MADPFLKLFIALLLYIVVLFFIRTINFGRKKVCENCNNCCPDCASALNRIKRNTRDRISSYLTFRVFDFKRYVCNECGWEGLRWEDKYRPGGN
jgi:uncharacterized protein with PIN domain